MKDLVELKCQSCGGPLARDGNGEYHCEYCGSRYRDKGSNRYIASTEVKLVQVNAPPVARIAAEVAVSRYLSDEHPEAASEISLDQLARKLADGLKSYMMLTAREDPHACAKIIRGEVRVVPPDFRF